MDLEEATVITRPYSGDIILRPYCMGSKSAFEIAYALKILRSTKDKYVNTPVINWGNTSKSKAKRIINKPEAVAIAVNKLKTFRTLTNKGIPTVPFTNDIEVAKAWLKNNFVVYCRGALESSQGGGITVALHEEDLKEVPIYTRGIMLSTEYRVHVFDGKVIDYTQKKRKSGVESSEFIRNSESGWVFCRENVTLPKAVESVSIAAIKALGLDFGAVDVLQSTINNGVYVLEINTAPGIEGTTLEKYKEAICLYVQKLGLSI